ncbi:MAG: hypothetical protein HDS24_00625 [Bacteroides sp.]|nr:hypothetical protein [Bacteroides sp.]
MKKNITIFLLAALIIAGIGIWVWSSVSTRNKEPEVTVAPAKMSHLGAIARLCTVELYAEVPVLDTIGNKVIFGIQKQRGRISFDIENLDIDPTADTIRVRLPKEHIEIYESTEPGSWEVVDTKNLSLIGSSKMTAEEENAVKRRIAENSRKRMYADGTVKRARKEGRATLSRLLAAFYNRTAIVSD